MGKCLQIRVELDNTLVGTSESASFLETFPGVFAVVCPAWWHGGGRGVLLKRLLTVSAVVPSAGCYEHSAASGKLSYDTRGCAPPRGTSGIPTLFYLQGRQVLTAQQPNVQPRCNNHTGRSHKPLSGSSNYIRVTGLIPHKSSSSSRCEPNMEYLFCILAGHLARKWYNVLSSLSHAEQFHNAQMTTECWMANKYFNVLSVQSQSKMC